MFSFFSLVLVARLIGTLRAQYAASEVYSPRGPVITGFVLDNNYGKVELQFDQEVVADSFNISQFTLQPQRAAISDSELFHMDGPVFNNLTLQGNTTSLTFYVANEDFARLALQSKIGKEESFTFAALGPTAVRSPFGRYNYGQNTSSAVQVTQLIQDTSPVYVTAFEIDMERQLVTLNFSEPVSPSTLDISGLAIQNQPNVLSSGTFVPLVATNSNLTAVSDFQRRITFQMGDINFNNINEGIDLCTHVSNCFASSTRAFIKDVSNNPVSNEGFNELFGMKCTNYSRDTTPPELLWWELNLGRGEVNIVFTEPVHMPFFNYSAVVILNKNTLASSTIVMRVQWPLKYYFENTHFVNFTLLPDQVNTLKEIDHIANDVNDTYLILEPNVVTDVARLANPYLGLDATPLNARKARKVHQDVTDPELIFAELDLRSWTLLLTFTEFVDVSTVDLREIGLLSERSVTLSTEILYLADPNDMNKITPSVATVRELEDSLTLHIDLTNITISKMKNMMYLGHSLETTYVALTVRFLTDLNGNTIRPIFYSWAKQIDEFHPDNGRPILISWDVNFASDLLLLRFSEPMNISSFDFNELLFSSDASLTVATAMVSPTRGSFVNMSFVQNEQFMVSIQLSYNDANAIRKKQNPRLCATFGDCYLSITENFGLDTISFDGNGSAVENKITAYGPERSASYSADITPPYLLSFSLDMNAGEISLVLSEPIVAADIQTTGITFFSSSEALEGVQLSRFCFPKEGTDLEMVTIILSRDDFLRLKMLPFFAMGTDVDTVWMAIGNSTFTDSSGNNFDGTQSVGTNTFLTPDGLRLHRPSQLKKNLRPPTINAIRWVGSSLSTYWDGVIEYSTVQEARIFISSFESIQVVSLVGATRVTSSNNHVVQFDILPIQNKFNSLNKIGVGQDNSNLYLLSAAAVTSVSGYPSAAIDRYTAIRTGNAILNFRLNMAAQVLSFELAFSMNYSSFVANGISLTRPSSSLSVSLTGALSISVLSGKFVELHLNAVDVLAIQSKVGLTDKADGLFLVVPKATIVELGTSHQLSRQFTVPCSSVIKDGVSPRVTGFDIDLGTGHFEVFFSKPILLSSVTASAFSFVDSKTSVQHVVQLSQSTIQTVSSSPATTVTSVILNLESGPHPTDRDRIHLTRAIGVSSGTIFLHVGEGRITDSSRPPNFLYQQAYSDAVSVNSFAADRVRPELLKFRLNMHTRQLVLYFSEAVNASSNKPNFYTILQNPQDIQAKSVRLQSSTTSSSSFVSPTSIITIDLSDGDVDTMMFFYPNLATSKLNSYLAVLPLAIRDISHSANGNPEIFYIFALAPDVFSIDRTPPSLINYDFSLDEGIVTFRFNEVMSCSSTNPSGVLFQHAAFSGSSSLVYRLDNDWSTVLPCHGDMSKTIVIKLGRIEVLRIKSHELLMKSHAHTYLRFGHETFFDISGNFATSITDGRAISVSNFVGDTASPHLLAFTGTRQSYLSLYFSEPVYSPSFNVTAIVMQDDEDDIPYLHKDQQIYHTVRLRNGEYFSFLANVDSFKMMYVVNMQKDQLKLLGFTSIMSSQKTTFLHFDETLVVDMSGNQVAPLPFGNPINVGPAIIIWNLDLNLNILTLGFSENVSSAFSPVGIIIQNSAAEANISVVLSETSSHFQSVSAELEMYTYLEVALDFGDVLKLRLSGLLNDYLSPSLYLSCEKNITRAISTASLSSLPYESTVIHSFDALPISDFWPDTLGPSCLHFTLDLQNGILIIYFSEPVDAASLKPTSISLLSFESGSLLKLTGLTSVTLVNYSAVSIKLSPSDLCYVKRATKNGVLEYMLFAEGGIVDSFGNEILGNTLSDLIPIHEFIPDISPPNVAFFTYNQHSRTMTLTFDEEIVIESLMPIKVRIANTTISDSREYLQLSNYTIVRFDDVEPPELPTVIVLDLGMLRVDADFLDAMETTAKELSSTFIELHEVSDIFGNQMMDTISYPCTEFIADTTLPNILSFDFTDVGANIDITVYFTEVMSIADFSCADLSFSSAMDFSSASHIVSLNSGDCMVATVVDSRAVSFTAPSNLFVATTIGAATSTTWMYVSSAGAQSKDIMGNSLELSTHAIKVGPQLSGFLIDMDAGIVTYVFSKPIDSAGTIATEGFGFFTINSMNKVFLSSGMNAPAVSAFVTTTLEVDYVLVFHLSDHDLNRVKSLSPLPGDIYTLINEDSVFDTLDVSIVSVIESDAVLALDVIPDMTKPTLLNAVLNKADDSLVLTYDEPILLSSVAFSKMILQPYPDSDESAIRLRGGTVEWSDEAGTELTISLLFDDAVLVKLHPTFGSTLSGSYLSFEFDFVTDMARNSIIPILTSAGRQFDSISPDTVPPELLSFTLDMNEHLLTLFFSEPIRANSVDPTGITLQNKFYVVDSTSAVYQLTGGSVSTSNSAEIVIALSSTDVMNIKNSWNLARLRTSSYLILSPSAAQDIAGNSVVGILNGFSMLCTIFTDDSIRPNVTAISLDYNTGIMSFLFSEPIDLRTVNPSQVTIYRISDRTELTDRDYYSLTASSVASLPSPHPIAEVVNLILSLTDLNNIRSRYPLGYLPSTTLISIAAGFCDDTSENQMWPIELWPINNLVKDVTPPTLQFYSLDMSLPFPVVTLRFSEAIDQRTITPNDCIIQSYPQRRFGSFVTMKHSRIEVGSGSLASTMMIFVDFDTANEMKMKRIGQEADGGEGFARSGLLSFGKVLFKDFGGKYIEPVYDRSIPGENNNPIVPDSFVADDRAPELYMWFFEGRSGTLYFRFSESVEVNQLTNFKVLISDSFSSSAGAYEIPAAASLNYSISFGSTVQVSNLGVDLLTALSSRSSSAVTYLFVNESSVMDRALVPNYLPKIVMKAEGAPVCDEPCPSGQFQSKQCTLSEDRVCTACSSCAEGEYEFESCGSYQDTQCAACGVCKYGTYISTQCRGKQDTICAHCTSCNGLRYEMSECAAGRDTICGTCEQCSFMDVDTQRECNSIIYLQWYDAHCCFDSEGKKLTSCNATAIEDMRIRARNSRHHWVYPDSLPLVEGERYRFPKKF